MTFESDARILRVHLSDGSRFWMHYDPTTIGQRVLVSFYDEYGDDDLRSTPFRTPDNFGIDLDTAEKVHRYFHPVWESHAEVTAVVDENTNRTNVRGRSGGHDTIDGA